MKGNPVHVVVDEGMSAFPLCGTEVFRAIFNASQMDQIPYVVWAYRIFRVFPRFNHGGDHWSVEVDASAWGGEVHPDRTASEIQ